MSTLPFPASIAATLPIPARTTTEALKRSTLRRPSRVQGQALETLAHAIEYLVDQHLVKRGGLMDVSRSPEFDAIQILMRLNCDVFGDCKPVVPLMHRLERFLLGAPARRNN